MLALPDDVAAPVPEDPPFIGVTVLRGSRLPLLSLRVLLGLPMEGFDRSKARIVVTRLGNAALGLVCDTMKAIVRAPSNAFDPVPAALKRGAGQARITSICRLDEGRRLVSILAADSLLDVATAERFLADAEPEAQMSSIADRSDKAEQFVIFLLGDEYYGLPIAAVDEVVRRPDAITRLPRAPAFMEGVMNLRGQDCSDHRSAATLCRGRAGSIAGTPDRRTDHRGSPGRLLGRRRQRDSGHLGQRAETGAGAYRRRCLFVRPRRHRRPGRAHDPADRSESVAGPHRTRPAGSTHHRLPHGRTRNGRRSSLRVIRLLIVDDSALMRRLLGSVFAAESDFEVAFARDGVEALERLGEFQPHVVTLDMHMPHMDGLTCLDRIMVEQPCPVVVVSSLTPEGADITLEAMELGAVDFMAKPGGAVSLAMDELAPRLVEKVRGAAKVRLRRSHRLTERVRRNAHGALPSEAARKPSPAGPKAFTLPTSSMPQVRTVLNSVVLVGVSTGGPPALDALLAPLPPDFPWPILVAQHMPATFTGPLSRRLDRLCALNVVEVTRPMAISAGHVYIGKGDADMIVSQRNGGPIVMAAPAQPQFRWHPSVDRLVSTALQHLGASHLIGVLMTGMGNDGAAAMTRLRAEGGHTIAEAEETAVVWGMPGELVKAGGAEIIAPLDEIAARLLEWAR